MMTTTERSGASSSAVEILAAAVARPALLLTCEHASNRLPEGWSWPEQDAWIVDQHWAWDPGAAVLTRRLAERLGAPAVLSRFSRLLVDPNRPVGSETMFRDVANGRPVWLNQGRTAQDEARRLRTCYAPYHAAVGAMAARHPGVPMLSMHTFTPLYEGSPREVELGVLFDRDEAWARLWWEALAGHGFDVRLNEPWSGRAGLMYSVQHHADRVGSRCVELEIRQDHATSPPQVDRLVDLLVRAAWSALAPERDQERPP